MARIESLEEEHVCADRSHGEVDDLGRLWLRDGRLPPEQASRLLTLLVQLRDLYRHHIATEDNEVFPRPRRPSPPPTVRQSAAKWRPGARSPAESDAGIALSSGTEFPAQPRER